jgi:hypothetical protein
MKYQGTSRTCVGLGASLHVWRCGVEILCSGNTTLPITESSRFSPNRPSTPYVPRSILLPHSSAHTPHGRTYSPSGLTVNLHQRHVLGCRKRPGQVVAIPNSCQFALQQCKPNTTGCVVNSNPGGMGTTRYHLLPGLVLNVNLVWKKGRREP